MTRCRPLAVLALGALALSCGKDPVREPPTITMITPDHGPAGGGVTVTIAGTNLSDDSDSPIVLVGGRMATILTATDTELTFMLPAGSDQTTVDVTVSDAHGFTTSPSAFSYNPIPIVLAVSPSGGPATGGTTITLTGRGFSDFEAGTVTVTIGSAAATSVQVVDDGTLTAVTSATTAGTPAFTALDVELSDANGLAVLPTSFSTTKQGLLLISRSDNSLSFFDPVTKNTTGIAPMSTRLHGCALGPDGTMYAQGRDPITGNHALFSFDPLSGDATEVGPTVDSTSGAQYALSGMAYIGSDMYGYVDGPCCGAIPKRLATIDLGTGSATLVGSAAVTVQRGAQIGVRDPATVFYAETTASTLDTLTLAGSKRVTGPLMSGGANTKVHGLVLFGTTLFLLEDGSPSTLYSVNPVSGELTTVSSTVPQGISLCQTPPSF